MIEHRVYQGDRLIWEGSHAEFRAATQRAIRRALYPDQEEQMGYAGERAAIAGGGQLDQLDRYASARSAAAPAQNGHRSPLAAATEQAFGVAEALRELIGRGHQQLDRIAGASPDLGLAKNPGGNEVEKQPPQLRQLENAVNATGAALEPLRHLINRLEAL